jgi:hypothetical protein
MAWHFVAQALKKVFELSICPTNKAGIPEVQSAYHLLYSVVKLDLNFPSLPQIHV